MRNKLQRWMMLIGMVCVMGLGTCGCGKTEEPEKSAVEEPEVLPDEAEEEEPKDQVPEEDLKNEAAGSGGQGERRTDKENLVGEIREIKDMQFIVAEIVTEEMEDGSELMTAPAEGADDSAFTQVTVIYDEDTLFYVRTIYENGARYEDSDASAEDLEKGQTVLVWGTYEGDGEKICAEQIQIEQFVH